MPGGDRPRSTRLQELAEIRRDNRAVAIDIDPLPAALLDDVCTLLNAPALRRELIAYRLKMILSLGSHVLANHAPNARAKARDAREGLGGPARRLLTKLDGLNPDALAHLNEQIGAQWQCSGVGPDRHMRIDHLSSMLADLVAAADSAAEERLERGPAVYQPLDFIVASLIHPFTEATGAEPTHNPQPEDAGDLVPRDIMVGRSRFDRFARLIVDYLLPGVGANTLNAAILAAIRRPQRK